MRRITFWILLSLTISGPSSQSQPYWVIETNRHQKDFTIIKFYNDQHVLIYERRQVGVYFDLSKKRHIRRLDLMSKIICLQGRLFPKKKRGEKEAEGFNKCQRFCFFQSPDPD